MSSQRGFTLLEVMVAVALLGLVVSVLAGSAIQGMSYEGEGARRLRASLLADQALFEIETGLKLGVPPQPMHEERQAGDGFELTVDVQPLDAAEALAALLAPAPEDPRAAAPSPRGAADATAVPLPLFQVLVRVAWAEGVNQREVTRTTFAFDASAAAKALGAGSGAATPTPEEPE